jgi:hypothetical protein
VQAIERPYVPIRHTEVLRLATRHRHYLTTNQRAYLDWTPGPCSIAQSP